jgi:serine/threonine protein kinase
MTSCPDDNQLAAFMEGGLSRRERRDLERHMDGCSMCRELLGDAVVGVTRMEGAAGRAGKDTLEMEDEEEGKVTLDMEDGDPNETLEISASELAPARGELRQGEMVDHFCVLTELGEGGMGRVYLARDVKLTRRVALKLIQPELLASDRIVRMFSREARAMARISHPNIVTVHSVGDYDGVPYVALEYVPGDTLRERYVDRRAELGDALRIAVGLAEGLAEAHRHGIVHRDLKPSNVILGQEDRPRIVDFGLADFVGTRTQTAAVTDAATLLDTAHTAPSDGGTPSYMSPEQWRGEEVTGATDVWALGVIIWEILTGERLFQGQSEIDLVGQICGDDELPSLRSKVNVPADVSVIVDACLSRSPEERPTAREAADALRKSLERVELAPYMESMASGSVPRPTSPSADVSVDQEAPTPLIGTMRRKEEPSAVTPLSVDEPVGAPRPPGDERVLRWVVVVAAVALLLGGVLLVGLGTADGPEIAPADAEREGSLPRAESASATASAGAAPSVSSAGRAPPSGSAAMQPPRRLVPVVPPPVDVFEER